MFVGEMPRSCTKLMKIHHMIIYCSELICHYGGKSVYFCVMWSCKGVMELRLHTFWITERWSSCSQPLHKRTLGICLMVGWMSLLEKNRNVTLLRKMPQSFRLIATHFTNSTIMTHCFVYHKRDALLSVILNLYLSIIYSFYRVLQTCNYNVCNHILNLLINDAGMWEEVHWIFITV